MKKQLLFLTLIFTTITSFAQFTVNDIEYTIIAGTDVEVSGSTLTTINIPAQVMDNGTNYDVIAIAADAFNINKGITITSAVLPNSVVSIGDHAFSGQGSLTSIDLTNVMTIGSNAFNANGLTGAIDLSGKSIGTYAFFQCAGIDSVTVNDATTLTEGSIRETSISEFTIPTTWTSLPNQLFRGTNIEAVSIPSSITSFGAAIFRACTSLTSIEVNWTDANDIVPATTGNFFNGVTTSNVTLFVPTTMANDYAAVGGWSDLIIVEGTLSTNDLKKLDVSLFPNPTKDIVTIKNNTQEGLKVSVYNLIGKELLTTTKSQIDISSFASGVYLFKVQSNSGYSVERILKN